MEKFTIKQFNDKYPDDDACLNEIFQQRYGSLATCPKCQKEAKFHRVKGRKCYKCQYCAYELHPLAYTIFHKSSTSLKNWFMAIYLFANSKNGVSGKELERHLGVTYKTAWRMAKQIRQLMQNQDQDGEMMCSIVEADETYVGGTYHSVSPKYLQSYVDEFAYRYNRRQHPEHLFSVLIPTAAKLI